jgi:solute:Na+ symporter, SSS family
MTFGLLNWMVLAAFILGTTLAGHLLKGKAKGLDGFFLGGQSLPWWAVSASIMASQISAVTVIAVPGAIFRPGGNLLFLQGTLFGFVVAKILMVLLFVKPFYEKKYFSPYDFIEDRLGAGSSTLSRVLFMLSAILGHGIRLLTVAIVLSVVIDIPVGQSVLIIGVFAVIWTLMGGITTVIWTDFILFGVIVGGVIVTLVNIINGLPFGLGEAIQQLDNAAKLRLLSFSLDPVKTWTVWTSLICFTIFELAQNSVDQVITQRMMCCRDYKQARKAVLGSLVIVLFTLLMAAVGLGVWLYYQHHPLSPTEVAFLAEQPSRAYPFYVIRNLPVGISGLVIAAIFAAGISTLDSALAALSETTINGIYRKRIRPHATEAHYLRVSRIAVVFWGVTLSSLAWAAGSLVQNEGLLNLAYKVPVITYGPMLMIALFALARRKVGHAALIASAVVSVVTALALVILSMRRLLPMDEFWIYPVTCLVFLGVVMAMANKRTPEPRMEQK